MPEPRTHQTASARADHNHDNDGGNGDNGGDRIACGL